MSDTHTRRVRSGETHLGVPQQLHNPSLVRREASNLPNDGANELGSCRRDALAVAGLDLLLNGGRGVTLVKANTKVYHTQQKV